MNDRLSLVPLTVIRTAFKGQYQRFFFAAFFLNASQVPLAFSQTEKKEIEFWSAYNPQSYAIGTGKTPGAAIRDLYRRQRHLEQLAEEKKKRGSVEIFTNSPN